MTTYTGAYIRSYLTYPRTGIRSSSHETSPQAIVRVKNNNGLSAHVSFEVALTIPIIANNDNILQR